MEGMGLEPLDRPTSLALRSLQGLIMLKTGKDLSILPALIYAGELGPALLVGLLGWLLTVACQLTGSAPPHLAEPPKRALVSLSMRRNEKERRLHLFLLVGRALLLAGEEQLTGPDLDAAQLIVEDLGNIAAEFS